MALFKNKGEFTKFQILAIIARQQPHLRQKDIADNLGITVQAVSENIKVLVESEYVETGNSTFRYKITAKGIDKVKIEAVNLKRYSDKVLNTMNGYKSIWPAIAAEDLHQGEQVWLNMDSGILYADTEDESSAYAEVFSDAKEGEDVVLINLGGEIELNPQSVTIVKIPPIAEGGSKVCDFDKIKEIYSEEYDRIGVMGTSSRAITNFLNIYPDFEFATAESTCVAAEKGLKVLVFAVGKMTSRITEKLEEKNIEYTLEDVKKK
ncbi:MAG: winged helix-turn-helix transcriptional regulator [Methanobacteriaceae archaeon]|nr:winged helix-turn-helix transcriptional regulator [Methanobacteriaceae archaeon]